MIALIRKFIKPRTMVREKILATKVGVCVLLLDINLMDNEREVLEETRDVLDFLVHQYDQSTRSLIRKHDS